jgi:hypothetical protein
MAPCWTAEPARSLGVNRKHGVALDALYVVYPGDRRYQLADRIEVVPLAALVAAR